MRKLTREEFAGLNLEERIAYLQALMGELQEKVEENRRQARQAGAQPASSADPRRSTPE